MDTTFGKQRRLSRLLRGEQKRALCLAFDHGLHLGSVPGVPEVRKTLKLACAAPVDGIILSAGVIMHQGPEFLTGPDAPAIVLRLDHTSMWRSGPPFAFDVGQTRQVFSVEQAARLGADAVITYLFLGFDNPELETRCFELNMRVAEEAQRLGIPHVIESMAARGGSVADPFDPAVVAAHTRIADELGADLIKTDWPGSAKAMAPISEGVSAPILVAGGSSLNDDEAVVRMTAEVLKGGAHGLMFGRNIFQAEDPARLLRQLRALIHDGVSVKKALAA